MNKKFKGIWIPVEVWELMISGAISTREVQLLSIIKNLENTDKGCFASNGYLGKMLNVRREYISRMIKNLKQRGFIELVKFDGRRRHIRTLSMVTDMSGTGSITNNAELTKEVNAALNDPYNAALHSSATPLPLTGEVDKKEYEDGGGFGFSPIEIPSDANPFDLDCCKKLGASLPPRKRKRIIPKSWPNSFRLLREVDEIEETEITQVLSWYLENYQDKWTPKCYTAKSFREKFNRIKDAIERKEPARKLEVKTTQEAENITNRLLNNNWPANCDDNLLGCVQLSLDAFESFRTGLNRLSDRTALEQPTDRAKKMRNKRFKSLLNHVSQSLPQSNHFVEQWFIAVWKRLNNWKDWNGDLQSFIFSETAQGFTKQLGDIFADYGRSATEVREFIRKVKQASNENYETGRQ